MKQMLIIFLVIVTIVSCSRKEDILPTPTNCDGLVTDTAGTGDNGRVYMPNAFTPNSDGLNDKSKPITQNITSIVFTITDELNRVLFTTTQIGLGWEPTSTPGASTQLFYRIEAVTTAGRHIGQCGNLYLLTCFPAGIPHGNFHFEDQLTPFGFTGVTAEALPNCP